jgi:hypothetical protein
MVTAETQRRREWLFARKRREYREYGKLESLAFIRVIRGLNLPPPSASPRLFGERIALTRNAVNG